MKKPLMLFCLGTCFCGQVSQAQYFTDMFTGTSVNPAFWQTTTPYSDSSVSESGGALTINNEGTLISAASLPKAVDVTVKFAFTGSTHDNFKLITRSFGVGSNGLLVTGGIIFQVQMQMDSGSTQANIILQEYTGTQLGTATIPVVLNQFYTIRAVDDGTNLTFYFNGSATPTLTAVDSGVWGNRIAMQDRQGAGSGSFISAGSQVKIDSFAINESSVTTVTNTVTIPDTSGRLVNLSTQGTGGFTMGFTINGTTAQTVLIRGVGPTLKSFGVANTATTTSLSLYSGTTIIGANSGWSANSNAAQISAAFSSTGAFVLPTGSADSAILTTLNPGSYTATVAGNGGVLLEVYGVP